MMNRCLGRLLPATALLLLTPVLNSCHRASPAADAQPKPRGPYVAGTLDPACSSPDGKPVCDVVQQVDKGFRDSDAAEIVAAYADDADWMNAIGIHLKGKQQLQSFLTRLLARPEISGSADSPMDIQSVRFVTPDVAVVYSFLKTTGQKSTKDGKPIDLRKTHEMQVLYRFNGKWLIVSDLISDENTAL